MKKFFTFMLALVAAVAVNAATEVTFNFSDASAYGYANPEAGKFTQVPSGAVLTKDDVTITITFEEGKNGFRFFAHSSTGVINLRAYVGSTFTIAAPEGKKLSAIVADGSNLTSQYLADGMTSKNWSSAEGVASLTTNVIKSTVQFNSLKVTLIEEGEVPPVQETVKVDVAGAIAAGMALDSAKTSTDLYEVTGYVVNAQAYSTQHNNQIWWMADDAENSAEQEFEAYACTVSEDKVVMQVLNGDKVTLTGNITKYYDKNAKKFIIEIKNGTAVFVSKAEGDHSIDGGGGTPAAPDTISVARALAIGDSIGQGKTTSERYVVDGYVISAEAFHQTNKNQTWTMADEADAASASFKAYRCVPMNGTDTLKVLKGDKVRICGAIQNYNGTIEISYVTAEFLSMVEGDHSYVDKPQETMDTITVARALEIGEALAAAGVSDSMYVIAGYVSSIIQPYDTAKKTESFWMVDSLGSRAASNVAGAFEVYQGKPDTVAGIDAFVYVTSKIKKYQPKSGEAVIETDGNPDVHVAQAGHEEIIESITVAKALEIGKDLAVGEVSGARYEITGYVSSIITSFDEEYKSETFWIVDSMGSRASSTAEGAFEVYHGKPNTGAEVGLYAKVKLVCKIKNYNGTIENDGSSIAVEVLEPGYIPDPDTISVAQALEIARKLDEEKSTQDEYVVVGYAVKVYDKNSDGSWSFYMADDADVEGEFMASSCKADSDVLQNDYMYVRGKITKHKSSSDNIILQIYKGKAVHGVAPEIPEITVAQALEIAQAFTPEPEKTMTTEQKYAIKAYVINIEDEEWYYLADSPDAESSEFRAREFASIDAEVNVGDLVIIIGRIETMNTPYGGKSYYSYYVSGGVLKHQSAEGIQQVVLTEKAQKIMIDGAIYIIRNGKMFDVRGAQVR